mmetsp:Transcript_6572/g.10862  ORF Transcript_6572/g.10862 Transcript_6572/m.10862 type:complete len:242 (-) Transcript_6572:945-1670(-)
MQVSPILLNPRSLDISRAFLWSGVRRLVSKPYMNGAKGKESDPSGGSIALKYSYLHLKTPGAPSRGRSCTTSAMQASHKLAPPARGAGKGGKSGPGVSGWGAKAPGGPSSAWVVGRGEACPPEPAGGLGRITGAWGESGPGVPGRGGAGAWRPLLGWGGWKRREVLPPGPGGGLGGQRRPGAPEAGYQGAARIPANGSTDKDTVLALVGSLAERSRPMARPTRPCSAVPLPPWRSGPASPT